ncbi:hypothetical protein Gotri_026668, partial [Gossypium trilobum]|nr:hypothetical protein [Gossypium trilobum]
PPIVDICDPNVFSLVRDACEQWGVFQVINHGTPLSLFQETEFEIRWLFSLPTERKQIVARFPGGYTGYGHLWNMLANFGLKIMPNSGNMRRGDGTISGGNDYIVRETSGNNAWLIVFGSNPKTSGNINGLQFYEDGMEWVDLEPVEGALIVNIGDLMQIVSNGRFKSVLHRVVANNTRHRISKWFFYLPPRDDVALPLKKLVEFDRLPMYRTVIWKEYVEFKATTFDNVLESIRI